MSPKAHLQWWVAVIMLVAASLYVHTGDDNTSNTRPPDVQLFPARLGAWNCVSSEGTKSEYEDQNVDKFWKAKCQKGASQPLDVFIGYSFHAGKKGRFLPPLLYFGQQEWEFPTNQSVSIDDVNQKGRKLNLMQRLLRNPQGSEVALSYWYQLSGNSYASDYGYRWALILRRLIRQPVRGQIVRITLPVEGLAQQEAFELEKELGLELWTLIQGELN
jgi:hypothetical protein